ncbi:subtilisin-like protease SBT4.15 [Gastrolobium bilobum]|uniref:subtilisin-like protease SBT4.15 n=1 Tax=Gastrolobium bilobum TaxID=150636 RepID=UPI002AAF4884|nr:subtilisin-like protease SBT4.15 [Gastrolobium bilobum]
MLQNMSLLLVFCTLYCLPFMLQGSNQHERKPYIVYMGELPLARTYAPEDHHLNLLEATIGDHQLARESKIHSYGKSFNGFVARLLPYEAKKLLQEENVVSVFPNTHSRIHTTRSWDFLGMPLKVTRRHSKIESNIIVGLLDTGISLDCPSFNDTGYGPPPSTWKGKCITGANFTGCNNKVIGAKYFNLEQTASTSEDNNLSPADEEGHGTHTASTAAGVAVKGANLYGIGRGTARGGVPSARIAVYKVCWGSSGCSDMDMLAAFDEAIADGVNLISVSIGGTPRPFFSDPMAIGSFHAMKRGILTSCSAGNDGPSTMTVENVAPWILTVAASAIDRQFTTVVSLGDGKKVAGMSINTFSPKKNMYPLITGALASNVTGDSYGNASACDYGTLSKDKVMGRIVYCLGTGSQDYVINELGGAGTIMSVVEQSDYSTTTIIPGVFVDATTEGKTIDLYINSTKNAQAIIHKTISTRSPGSYIASFSSRGPQFITFNILKPDLAAPGLDILAGYSTLASITGYSEDNRHNFFNIISGTSMACPHAAGAAAYVKSFHPHWSPAAIKSALMTTATPMRIKDETAELGSGSGQINPVRALDPGLIYDINMNSYIAFLCKEGYNSTSIGILIGSKGFDCSSISSAQGTDGINYPSMHTQIMQANSSISAIFYRNVTNVGFANSTYKAKVTAPKGLSIVVVPDTLQFSRLNQELSFKVALKGPSMPKETKILSGSLEWNDSKHSVRSPIVVYKPMR